MADTAIKWVVTYHSVGNGPIGVYVELVRRAELPLGIGLFYEANDVYDTLDLARGEAISRAKAGSRGAKYAAMTKKINGRFTGYSSIIWSSWMQASQDESESCKLACSCIQDFGRCIHA